MCPACNKREVALRTYGLCLTCFQSLHTWLLEKCGALKYTKRQTGLVLMVAAFIGEWLKEQQSAS